MFKINPGLKNLRAAFVAAGFDIRFVGGCVRDYVLGLEPDDFDLCTDATPDQQVALYNSTDTTFYETGLKHGTVTVNVGGELFEITSLRVEKNHDGRYAEMEFTNDWIADLARRDLTFNAMSMTFDGVVTDPFDGMRDLINKRCRFVGDPNQRIKEDYLRILRYARFCARFDAFMEPEQVAGIMANASGLKGISRERVWSEISKMLTYKSGLMNMRALEHCGINEHIGLPTGLNYRLAESIMTDDPVLKMVALLYCHDDVDIGRSWKWSNEKRAKFKFIKDNAFTSKTPEELLVVDEAPKELVKAWCEFRGYAWTYENAVFNECPVNGHDVMALGYKGAKIGIVLAKIKWEWFYDGMNVPKEKLLKKYKEGA